MDGKAAGIKLEGGTAAPVAGESLNRPDESQLSSVRFPLSPMVWLRQPAPISSACHGGSDWVWKSYATIGDSWLNVLTKRLLLEERLRRRRW